MDREPALASSTAVPTTAGQASGEGFRPSLASTPDEQPGYDGEGSVPRGPVLSGSLRVEVVAPGGSPMSHADVFIHRAEFCVPDPFGSREQSGRADDQGVKTFDNLAAGPWHVVARTRMTQTHLVPGPRTGQVHVETTVRAGKQTRVVVRLDEGIVIAGRVILPDDGTFEGIGVSALSEIGCGIREMTVEADGSFRMEGLCHGPWWCYASTGGSGGGLRSWGGTTWASIEEIRLSGSAPIVVTESREDVELVLRKSGSISGRIEGMGDGRWRGVAINRESGHRYAMRLDEGSFSAIGLDPGTYMVLAAGEEAWAVLDGVRVEEGSAVSGLEIPVKPAARLSVSSPSDEARTSVFLNGVLLPTEKVAGFPRMLSVPQGELNVEVHFAGLVQAQSLVAVAGETLELLF